MEFLEVLLDALIDTAKLMPLLFIVYYLIELIEYKYAAKMQKSVLLKGKASPIFGSLLGCVPQCGFSVVSTDLFAKKAISIGALMAVYIATSDEAIPLMLAEPSSMPWLLGLIGIKVVAGILIGYLTSLLYKVVFKNKAQSIKPAIQASIMSVTENIDGQNLLHVKTNFPDAHDNDHEEEDHENSGCCHHHVKAKSFDWKHPLLHCIKIGLFILVINIIFGCITELWIGEERLISFLDASIFAQPVLAVLIGLIPNCVSSVVLTELFLMGGLSFGSLVAGLCVNAGVGLIILFKQNKNIKENLFIIVMLIVPSIILGYGINAIVTLF